MNINPSKIDNLESLSEKDLRQVISFYLDEKVFAGLLCEIHPIDKAKMRSQITDLIEMVVKLSTDYIFDKETTEPFALKYAKMLKKDYEQKREEKIQG